VALGLVSKHSATWPTLPVPFALGYPLDKVSIVLFVYFWPRLRCYFQFVSLPPLIGWDGASLTFCPGWPQTAIPSRESLLNEFELLHPSLCNGNLADS
jgi:hypothetical protein